MRVRITERTVAQSFHYITMLIEQKNWADTGDSLASIVLILTGLNLM